MKVYLNSRFALVYQGGFDKMDELAALLKKQRIEMRVVEPEVLGLSVAALAGYVDAPPPTLEFEGEPPKESCVVFSGLTEQRLGRVLDALREEKLGVDYKAVLTGENRNWAFGALMREMEKENAEQQEKEEK